ITSHTGFQIWAEVMCGLWCKAIHGFPFVNHRNVKEAVGPELRFLLFYTRAWSGLRAFNNWLDLRRRRRRQRGRPFQAGCRSFRVVENDSHRVPPAGVNPAHAVTEIDAVS